MKTAGNIRQQLKQVQFRHLKKELKARLRKRPHNCVWNRTLDLPDGSQVSFCGLYAEDPNGGWQGLVCDEAYGGRELAGGCPVFEPAATKEEIRTEFHQLMEGDLGAIAAQYPDVAALKWVLDGEEKGEFDVDRVDVDLPKVEYPLRETESDPPRRNWIVRLWRRIRGTRSLG